jgi:hypothetical protein
MLDVSLATIRKWECATAESGGAATDSRAVARLHPEAIREALLLGK